MNPIFGTFWVKRNEPERKQSWFPALAADVETRVDAVFPGALASVDPGREDTYTSDMIVFTATTKPDYVFVTGPDGKSFEPSRRLLFKAHRAIVISMRDECATWMTNTLLDRISHKDAAEATYRLGQADGKFKSDMIFFRPDLVMQGGASSIASCTISSAQISPAQIQQMQAQLQAYGTSSTSSTSYMGKHLNAIPHSLKPKKP